MPEEFKLKNLEEAEQRIDQIVLESGIKPLEEDWVSIKFELKRIRKENAELKTQNKSLEDEILLNTNSYYEPNIAKR